MSEEGELAVTLSGGDTVPAQLVGRDSTTDRAQPLLENADPDILIGDKAYDADPFVAILTERGITPVIPPKANRKTQRLCDFALYCERNLVERFFNQLKHFRAVATRA